MHGPLDPFDPNSWSLKGDHEFRIYGDDYASLWAVVDEVDYHWAVRWRWYPKVSKGGKKVYLCRTQTIRCGATRRDECHYLHVEIQKRTGIAPPTPQHTMVDHRNGDGLHCRRYNLRWATPKMNRANWFGACPHDLIDG